MTVEIKVPLLPESVTDATVSVWHKKAGDQIVRDENLVDLETDKVMLEVPSPVDGVLQEIKSPEGATVCANDVIAIIEKSTVKKSDQIAQSTSDEKIGQEGAANETNTFDQQVSDSSPVPLVPSVRRAAAELNADVTKITGTGKGGRITRENVITQINTPAATKQSIGIDGSNSGMRIEKRVPMSRIRQRIAERLLDVAQSTAMLTTFNEINLAKVMELRKQYRDSFEKRHGIRLGFMSFFVKAVVEALKRSPAVNASIDDDEIVYHGFYDIGVAVSTDRGLVVPILRDADLMDMAEVESKIVNFAEKARAGKLTIDEMRGGTFTITNGGVFGSLLSTPILNSPQSAILGMHKIEQRAVVENGEIVARPMMYVALSYDHRIIDGKESVTFLKTIKDLLEDPARLVLGV